jgi:hypothetical protein
MGLAGLEEELAVCTDQPETLGKHFKRRNARKFLASRACSLVIPGNSR